MEEDGEPKKKIKVFKKVLIIPKVFKIFSQT